MTNGIHLHNLQDYTDNSLSAFDNTDSDSNPGQGTPADFQALSPAVSVTPAALTDTLYLTEAGTSSAISVADINQGQLGDCFLLSPIGELALFHPATISNMIHANSNGTETVTLYTDKNGRLPSFNTTSFKATTVTINNSFSSLSVDNGANQDRVGNLKEIWPQVLEKAAATLDGSYAAIANGGYPTLAMEELTGYTASAMSPAALSLTELQQFVSAGDLITMDTAARNGLPDGLVGGHCYMFEKVNGSGNSATVTLGNPWGMDQPAAIPLTQLAKSGIVEVDIGRVA